MPKMFRKQPLTIVVRFQMQNCDNSCTRVMTGSIWVAVIFIGGWGITIRCTLVRYWLSSSHVIWGCVLTRKPLLMHARLRLCRQCMHACTCKSSFCLPLAEYRRVSWRKSLALRSGGLPLEHCVLSCFCVDWFLSSKNQSVSWFRITCC